MSDEFEYDVFLSHASADKAAVRELAERLKGDGLRVWLDEWVIQPGDSIPLAIEQGLEARGRWSWPSTPNRSRSNDTPHFSVTPPTSKDDSYHYDSTTVENGELTVEHYQCFYPSSRFWAGATPDFSVLKKGGIRLYDVLAEEVFCYERDAFVIKFCRDGLCMAQLKSLDEEITELRSQEAVPSISKTEKRDINKRFVELSLKYVEYFNTLLLLLDAALLEVDQFAFFHTSCLRLGDVFPLVWDDSKLWPIVDYSGVRGFHSVRDDLHRARLEWNYDPSRSIEEDERISGRRVLAQLVFDRAVEQFEKVYLDYDKIQLLSQVTKALDFYNTMDWAASLIHAWFVIEVFVNSVWIDYLSDRVEESTNENSRIDSERRNTLLGRDYTASIMTNVLELSGEIDHDVFRKIEAVRQKRNDVAHSLEIVARLGDKLRSEPGKKKERTVGADHCLEAFTVISHFAKKRFELDLGLEKVR